MRMVRLSCVEVFMRSIVAAVTLLTLAASAQAEDLTYDVQSGKTASELMYVRLESCAAYGQYRTKVLKEPAHGKLVIRPETFVNMAPPCDGHKFVGTRLSYTSNKGLKEPIACRSASGILRILRACVISIRPTT
jgi:hypothetical protein